MAKFGCFTDLMITQKSKGATKLERIEALVNWKRLDYRIKKVLNRSGLGPAGYNYMNLFKALVLQNLYGLSDPEMEEMLYDRLSFRRFCGFSLKDNIPDETTLCRFRGALVGHTDKLFDLVMQDIAQHGVRLKGGTVVDATVITSAVKPPRGGEVSEKDAEAGWTKKNNTYVYGYKAHVSCDEQGLIKKVIATSADVHDSQVCAQLLDGSEEAVYADKGYDSKENRALLEARGITPKIMYKGVRGNKQPQWQRVLNKLWSKTRSGIERIFGHWKTFMGLGRSRYRGWDKHQAHFDLVAISYNLARAVKLRPRATG